MLRIESKKEMRELRESFSPGETVSLVPTMGSLHSGHISLIRESFKLSQSVIVSIFLNPIQFDNPEDLEKYPVRLASDLQLLEDMGVYAVFIPKWNEMYPQNFQTYVINESLSNTLCGLKRPTHFKGVCTVVLKLINLVEPHFIFFGKKDFQQYKIIEHMISDLDLKTQIVATDTIREEDGLALSSRNLRLSKKARSLATSLYHELLAGRQLLHEGERDPLRIINHIKRNLSTYSDIQVDYIDIRNSVDLSPSTVTNIHKSIIFGAVVIENVRLIDNIPL